MGAIDVRGSAYRLRNGPTAFWTIDFMDAVPPTKSFLRLHVQRDFDQFSNNPIASHISKSDGIRRKGKCAAATCLSPSPHLLLPQPPPCYLPRMTKLEELTQDVAALAPDELARFRAWFAEYDAAKWEIEADARSGRLDALGDAALAAHRAGWSRPL